MMGNKLLHTTAAGLLSRRPAILLSAGFVVGWLSCLLLTPQNCSRASNRGGLEHAGKPSWLSFNAGSLPTVYGRLKQSPSQLSKEERESQSESKEISLPPPSTHPTSQFVPAGQKGLLATPQSLTVCHRKMNSRGEMMALLNEVGLVGEAVEIGVSRGEFSEAILSRWKGKLLHLVDPWQKSDGKLGNDVSKAAQDEQEQYFVKVSALCSEGQFKGRCSVHRSSSTEAATAFSTDSLDFVYVDAIHDYEGVLEDLDAWWSKLRQGGMFAGHDFVPDGNLAAGTFGVQKAVFEFAQRVGKEVQSISSKNKDGGRQEPQHLDGGWTTWYFFK